MKTLQWVVAGLGVLILFATTALVVMVIKKPSRNAGAASVPGVSGVFEKNIDGRYVTSYGVGENLAVVTEKSGQKAITLYRGDDLRLVGRLIISDRP